MVLMHSEPGSALQGAAAGAEAASSAIGAARGVFEEQLRVRSKLYALLSWMLRASDLVLLVATGWLVHWLRFGVAGLGADYAQAIGRGVLFALIVLSGTSLYRSWRGRRVASELLKLTTLWLLMFGLMALYAVVMKDGDHLSRVWWFGWFSLSLTAAMAMRIVVRGTADALRSRGFDVRSAVVIGANHDAHRIVQTLQSQSWAGIRVHGWFSASVDSHAIESVPRLGDLSDLAAYVQRERIDQVWIALPMSAQHKIARILQELYHSTTNIKFVPDLFGMELLNHSVEQMAGLPVINLRDSPLEGNARVLKAIEDRVLAACILTLISPLLILIGVAVKLSSPGPIIFRQLRHGIGGQPIEVWKFRSMHVHEERDGHVAQATRGDRRVTPLGAFLRRTSLDELPQFINVLQGTMSIVGPRPHALAHNEQYKELVGRYMQRHRVKPGITGWAQVNGLRGETDTLEKMAKRVEYDLYYLQNWSLGFDLKIIFYTVFTGFINHNAY